MALPALLPRRGHRIGSHAPIRCCRCAIASSPAARSLADWLRGSMALVPAAPAVSVARHARFAAHRERSVVWRDVLPPELCTAVTACATDASLLEEQENVLESTFQRTRWLPVEQVPTTTTSTVPSPSQFLTQLRSPRGEQLSHPRTAIEAAVAHLQREVLRLTQADGLVGCEWYPTSISPSPNHFIVQK